LTALGVLARIPATREGPTMQQQSLSLQEEPDERFHSFSPQVQQAVLELMAALIIQIQSLERPDHERHIDGQ
jgi:hypothetical protein